MSQIDRSCRALFFSISNYNSLFILVYFSLFIKITLLNNGQISVFNYLLTLFHILIKYVVLSKSLRCPMFAVFTCMRIIMFTLCLLI